MVTDAEHIQPGQAFDWRAFDAYLFDIDGTLLNSRDRVHYEAFLNAMQAMYGRPIPLEGITLHGSTDPLILLEAMVRSGISPAEGRTALPEAVERMCNEVEARASELRPELCPDVSRLLDELDAARKLLALASGNVERIGWAKVRAAGIHQYFRFGSFADLRETRTEIFRWGANEARRLLGNEARICCVGDTPADVQAAHACQLPVIAVATGIFSAERLRQEHPELCISACEVLLRSAR
jgi:phosphoglycolate phosphatase-like HAD superfamily hydrolase